ncbi:complement factor H-related protein 2-like [Cheilinus undulatus]|uniref:complement factor H-related protein 2-like n=1 Tax=Cheilinus undulatus TaxID=241271 RepID=UPI001BD41E16|nr:complement factor H-related protein 2-like [Cheilinus undulatus]
MRVALLVFLFALWLNTDISSSQTVPLGCGRPPLLIDGDVRETMKPQYNHNERVEYMCQSLYTMEGHPYRTCINGEWTGSMRCRKPCIVTAETISKYNIHFRYTLANKLFLSHNDAVTFSCTEGRQPVASQSMRQRCADGVVNFPTCQ